MVYSGRALGLRKREKEGWTYLTRQNIRSGHTRRVNKEQDKDCNCTILSNDLAEILGEIIAVWGIDNRVDITDAEEHNDQGRYGDRPWIGC